MGSTAALMQGLQSFDSSEAEGTRDGTGQGAGLSTLLGSVGESFHSEDYDPVRPSLARGTGEDESESSLFEEQEGDDLDLDFAQASLHDADDEQLDLPPPRPATASSALYRLGETTADASHAHSHADALNELTLDDDDSRDDRYARTASRASASTSAGGGKKKGPDAKAAGGGHLTLREQEKVIDEFKKENFDLKLKIHFYEQRLDQLAPDQVNQTIRENIALRVEFTTAKTELKRHKRLLLDAGRALETVTVERDQLAQNGRRESDRELARRAAREDRERAEREALEQRSRDQQAELKDLRELVKKRRGDEWEGEDAREEISRLRDELDAERDAREDALGEQDDLRAQLRELQNQLDEAIDQRDNYSNSNSVSVGDGRRGRDKEGRRELERFERKIGDLEQEKASLRSQITAQVTMLSARNAEKEALRDEVEALKQDLAHLESELEQHDKQVARSERSLDASGGEDKPREELERENGEYRDRASAHALQIEQLERQLDEKETELEEILQDLDQRDVDHAAALKQVEDEWRQEVDDARTREDEARGILEDKEAENEELADRVEGLVRELEAKEVEMQADSEEVEALTEDLRKLGEQIFALEEEGEEKDKRMLELETELSAVDKELEDKQSMHEQVVHALKEKVNTTKACLSELSIQHESSQTENKFLREKVEDLALRTAELEEKSRSDLEARRRLEDELEDLMRALRKEEEERDLDQHEWNRQREDEEARWGQTFDARDREVKNAQSDLAQVRAVLVAREADVQKLQDALNRIQSESRRLGESHTNDRFSLELELDRLKRDVKRYEDDHEREKDETAKREKDLRERDLAVATLNSENKDLAAQVASLTQLRLNLTDKYDLQVRSLRDAQADLSAARDRLKVVEDQLNADHRALNRTEAQYRDQLTERNTLLLTIYQYMDKMVPEKSPRKSGADPKPFTNFNVFHDALIGRVKAVNQIQLSFDRRTREIEIKFQDQFNTLKRQQESRLRQLDRFEGALKTATETQRQWRQRVNVKQLELEAAKGTNAELQAQVASLRMRASTGPADPATAAKLSVLSTRASTAERRLAATAAQLASAEEKLGEARTKVGVAEGKWEARLRELEARLRAAEEKVKRERQGAKERIGELAETIQNLEGQVKGARKRDDQLGDVIRTTVERDRDTSND